MLQQVLFFCCCLFSGLACAAAQPLILQAKERRLSEHPYWRALLHYKGGSSEIVSPEFFLSPQGSADAAAELAATLAALIEAPGDKPDNHAQCRFPARYKWLRTSLDWGALKPPPLACPQYAAYTMQHNVESLSLIYATGYFSNPASFFGHILLRFNTRRSVQPSELLDQSLNFGAAVPPNENGLVYVVKGLFGGYGASFTHQQFYAVNHAYAENELRDLWEYELALTGDEVEQIVAHSWELLAKSYPYYFLDENCGYRMAELMQLVVGEPLLPDLPWSIPAVVFDRLAKAQRDGKPIVREVRRIPSRQSRFRERYEAMTPAERSAAARMVEEGLDLSQAAYRTLDERSKVAVIDTLLDYYEYRAIVGKQAAELKRAKQMLLIERAGLPARGADEADPPTQARPPHEGPLPFTVRLGALYNYDRGAGAGLRIRPANYDPLSLDAARIPHSELEMFDLKLVVLDARVRLRHLDFISVENMSLARTPLPGDGGLAWTFKIGLEAHDLACGGCTEAKARYGLGKALPLPRGGAAFGMLDVFVQTEHENSGSVGAMPRLGAFAEPLQGWKTSISVGRQTFFNGERRETSVVRWENRLGSSRRWDLRLSYEENAAREVEAALSYYW
jgi:Domain of unknown function (DUF4105)